MDLSDSKTFDALCFPLMTIPSRLIRALALILPVALLVCAGWFLLQEDRGDSLSSANPESVIDGKSITISNEEDIRHADEVARASQDSDPVEEFRSWAEKTKSTEGQESRNLELGLRLARQRQEVMLKLIREDPREALRNAFSYDERESLPEEVKALVETPFSEGVEMDVFPRCASSEEGEAKSEEISKPSWQPNDVKITLSDGSELDTFVYGNRLAALSRESVPVQGVSLGGSAAIYEDPFQFLEPRETDAAKRIFPQGNRKAEIDFYTGKKIEGDPIVALANGKYYQFASRENVEALNRRAAAIERNLGPGNGSQLLFALRHQDDETGALDTDSAEEESEEIAAITSNTTRSAIMILVDFSDKVGTPIAVNTLQTRMDGEVHDQVASMSYHKTGIDATVHPTVFRMPRPASYYNGTDDGSKKNGTLFNDAIALANAAGLNTGSYNHRCIMFKGIGMGYCGLATVGGSKVWLPCHSSKVIVHELGHNFGLGHASLWTSDDANPVGAGSSSEYGDNTDIMGGGGVSSGHFHVQGKRKLNWLESDQYHNIGTNAGTRQLRIHRFDHEDTALANAKRAIRVTKGSSEYYWIGYRQRFTANKHDFYEKGVQLVWQQPNKSKSWLIDLNSGGGKDNAGLPIGKTYSDATAKIHITTLKRGGSNPNQWIDVQVNTGDFAGNNAPTAVLNLPSRVPVNTAITFGATAEDPDGDAMSYFFGDGDGLVFGNDGSLSSRTKTWTSIGSETITLTVSDKKGGEVTRTKTIQVVAAIPAPASLTASDGEFSDKVELSWSAVSGATSYVVYRSKTTSSGGATAVATVGAVTSFNDGGAVPGEIFTYWVQALSSNQASALSPADTGNRALGPPVKPGGFTISKGGRPDSVIMMWSDDPTATAFDILRNANGDQGSAEVVGSTTTGLFIDNTALSGVLYTYWISARNAQGSTVSDSGTGWVKMGSPQNVAASDRFSSDSITISWDEVNGAEDYEVYRNFSANSGGALIGEITGTQFIDHVSGGLEEHWYSVKARHSIMGTSDYSLADSGSKTFRGPGRVRATQGFYEEKIRLTWSVASSPSGGDLLYEILRAELGESYGDAAVVGSSSTETFDDGSATPGVDYQYWVRAIDGETGMVSATSEATAGSSATSPPFLPDLMIGSNSRNLKVDDLYTTSGAPQTVKLKSIKRRSLRWQVTIENDGGLTDNLKLSSNRMSRYFKVSIRESFGAQRQVSSLLPTHRYILYNWEPGTKNGYLISVKPSRRTTGKRVRSSLLLTGSSVNHPNRIDRVRANAETVRRR